ncbi:MarR family winged helix-turn-helix transcriptional regulator [Aquimarina megaterium]|uniref:MarR family winged helix-turn-helix transcriptional regulator n=1 Tax=Aquimarina megaterium TaxID=1443666 RepID=UPI0009F59783|nr:MarR family transcriptional regulator [Aquimarina megaterium]
MKILLQIYNISSCEDIFSYFHLKINTLKMNNSDLIDLLQSEWKNERPELNTSGMQIVGRILMLGKILERRAGVAVVGFNIHYTDLDVMATIRRSGNPYELTPSQLMKSVLISSGAMTALINRLTKLELVYRSSNSKDGRMKLVGLTEKGLKIIDEAIEWRMIEASESIKTLSESEKKELSELLKKLLISLDS